MENALPHNLFLSKDEVFYSQQNGIIKYKYDTSSYNCIVLDNGMQIFLMENQSSDKSYFHMNVNVGSYQNHKDFNGLPHFLEHMLFLGSKKYPHEGTFINLINTNMGNTNAYTNSINTCYYFNMPNANPINVLQIIDVFAHLFIDPLFNFDNIKNEINAVNSEHESAINSDKYRIAEIIKIFYNQTNPLQYFATGTINSLLGNNNIDDLFSALLAFFKTYYVANNMTLFIYHNNIDDDFINIIKILFSSLPKGKAISQLMMDEIEHKQVTNLSHNIFIDKTKSHQIKIKSMEANNSMHVHWNINKLNDLCGKSILNLLIFIINHKDTLYTILHNNDFIMNLSCEITDETYDQCIFVLRVILSENGKKYYETVRNYLVDFMEHIETYIISTDVVQYYNDMKNNKLLNFININDLSIDNIIENIIETSTIYNINPHFYLITNLFFYDNAIINTKLRDYIKQNFSNNYICVLSLNNNDNNNDNNDSNENEFTNIFRTISYTTEVISASTNKLLIKSTKSCPLIPKNIKYVTYKYKYCDIISNIVKYDTMKYNTSIVKPKAAFHQHDNIYYYRLPAVQIKYRLILSYDHIITTNQEQYILFLYINYILFNYETFFYYLHLLNMNINFDIDPINNNIIIDVKTYECYFDELSCDLFNILFSKVQSENVNIFISQMKQKLINRQYNNLCEKVINIYFENNNAQYINEKRLLYILSSNINFDHIGDVIKKCKYNAILIGNINMTMVNKLKILIKNIGFASQSQYHKNDSENNKILKIQKNINMYDNNTAILVSYLFAQIDTSTIKNACIKICLIKILDILISTHFFTIMRVKKRLGYTVKNKFNTIIINNNNYVHLNLIVQSDKYNVAQLNKEIKDGMDLIILKINDTTSSEIKNIISNLILSEKIKQGETNSKENKDISNNNLNNIINYYENLTNLNLTNLNDMNYYNKCILNTFMYLHKNLKIKHIMKILNTKITKNNQINIYAIESSIHEK